MSTSSSNEGCIALSRASNSSKDTYAASFSEEDIRPEHRRLRIVSVKFDINPYVSLEELEALDRAMHPSLDEEVDITNYVEDDLGRPMSSVSVDARYEYFEYEDEDASRNGFKKGRLDGLEFNKRPVL